VGRLSWCWFVCVGALCGGCDAPPQATAEPVPDVGVAEAGPPGPPSVQPDTGTRLSPDVGGPAFDDAPTLSALTVVFDGTQRVLGLRARVDRTPNDFQLEFYGGDLDGEALEAAADDPSWATWDGAQLWVWVRINTPATPPDRARLRVSSSEDVWSAPLEANVGTPRSVGMAAPCDPRRVVDQCAEGAACLGEPSTCQPAAPPVLLSARAYLQPDVMTLGLRVLGVDPDDDLTAVELLPLDGAGAPLALDADGGFQAVAPEWIAEAPEGQRELAVAAPAVFEAACVPPAQDEYDRCVSRGEDEPACLERAIALADSCFVEQMPRLRSVRVRLLDAGGQRSESLEVEWEAVPELVAGDRCDGPGATGVCPEGTGCAALVEDAQAPRCEAPRAECPEAWSAVELGEETHESAGAEGPGGHGSCGGGRGVPHRYVPTRSGAHRVDAWAVEPGRDPVLWARSHCAFEDLGFELACNDDRAPGELDSALDLRLVEGEPVFLFVSGFAGSPLGAYRLRITAAP
jgi:hypothetical protein